MANREGCRSLYEAWQNRNPQISQMHTDISDTCLPSSFIRENLRHLWIDRVSKVMALHRRPWHAPWHSVPPLRRESGSRHRLLETSTSRAFNHLRLRTAQPPPVESECNDGTAKPPHRAKSCHDTSRKRLDGELIHR